MGLMCLLLFGCGYDGVLLAFSLVFVFCVGVWGLLGLLCGLRVLGLV